MKFSLKSEAAPILIILASWAIGIYFYLHFGDSVITHWGFNGQPNGYSSKFFGALFPPILMTAMYFLFWIFPAIDPKKERYESFAGIYSNFKVLILAMLFVISLITGLVNLGYNISVNKTIPFIIGVFFIVLGNYLGKIKQNWFIGIRFPWTLASENVWNKTNRFGGRMMMLCGLCVMFSPLLPEFWGITLFVIGVALVSIGSGVYSYLEFRKEQKAKA